MLSRAHLRTTKDGRSQLTVPQQKKGFFNPSWEGLFSLLSLLVVVLTFLVGTAIGELAIIAAIGEPQDVAYYENAVEFIFEGTAIAAVTGMLLLFLILQLCMIHSEDHAGTSLYFRNNKVLIFLIAIGVVALLWVLGGAQIDLLWNIMRPQEKYMNILNKCWLYFQLGSYIGIACLVITAVQWYTNGYYTSTKKLIGLNFDISVRTALQAHSEEFASTYTELFESAKIEVRQFPQLTIEHLTSINIPLGHALSLHDFFGSLEFSSKSTDDFGSERKHEWGFEKTHTSTEFSAGSKL